MLSFIESSFICLLGWAIAVIEFNVIIFQRLKINSIEKRLLKLESEFIKYLKIRDRK